MDERKRKDSVVLHVEDFECIDELKDGDAGKLLKTILAYTMDPEQELPKLGVQARTMWNYIRRHIDRDTARYEDTCAKRAAAGKKGGRPRKEPFDFEEKAKKANGFSEKQKNPERDPERDPEPEREPERDPEPEREPERDSDPERDPVAAPGGGPGDEAASGLWSEEAKANRIRFLETTCGLYETGAMRDDESYRRYARELRQLKGG